MKLTLYILINWVGDTSVPYQLSFQDPATTTVGSIDIFTTITAFFETSVLRDVSIFVLIVYGCCFYIMLFPGDPEDPEDKKTSELESEYQKQQRLKKWRKTFYKNMSEHKVPKDWYKPHHAGIERFIKPPRW